MPVTACESVDEYCCVSIVPPFAPIEIARVAARSRSLFNCSVPPLNVTPPVAAPSALSAAMLSVPCVISVPPEYVLPPVAAGARNKRARSRFSRSRRYRSTSPYKCRHRFA